VLLSYGVSLCHFSLLTQYAEGYRILRENKYFGISRIIVDNGIPRVYYPIMEHEDAAKRLCELGNTTRLSIFRYLIKVGTDGVPVGQIQKALGIPGSTLSHHISRMVSVGLIRQNRESRTLYCTAQYDALRELIDFLKSECCTGEDKCN
jgi:ArsR family transcriptional regulator